MRVVYPMSKINVARDIAPEEFHLFLQIFFEVCTPNSMGPTFSRYIPSQPNEDVQFLTVVDFHDSPNQGELADHLATHHEEPLIDLLGDTSNLLTTHNLIGHTRFDILFQTGQRRKSWVVF